MKRIIAVTLAVGLLVVVGRAISLADPEPREYSYDFSAGAGGWDLGADWSLGERPGWGAVLVGTGNGWARHVEGTGTLRSLSCRLRMDPALAYFCVRFGGGSEQSGVGYSVCLESMAVSVIRLDAGSGSEIAFAPFSVEGGLSHTVTVLTGDGSLDVYVDGFGVVGVDAADPAPGSAVLAAGPLEVVVDDVAIVLDGSGSGHPRAPRPLADLPPGPDVGPFVNGKVTGDVTLSGEQRLELSGGLYEVSDGNVYVTEDAALVIAEDGALAFGVEESPLVHWGVHVSGSGRFEVQGGRLEGIGAGGLMVADVSGDGTIALRGCQPQIHILQAEGRSTVLLDGVRLVTPIGGQVAVAGDATVDINGSVISSIALDLPKGSSLRASDLRWGQYLESFDVRRDLDISGVGYQLRIRDSVLQPSLMSDGANEKGWLVAASRDATVQLSDSELGKLNLGIPDGTDEVVVRDLTIGEPCDLSIGGIELRDVTVRQQWGFFVEGSRRIVFEDSEGVWLFLFDSVEAVLRRSTMSEFDPRGFTGTVTFENGRWLSAACEIIDDNDFVLRGSLRTTPGLSACSWSESTMRREIGVIVRNRFGLRVPAATVTATDGTSSVTATTDENGVALLTIECDDESRLSTWTITGPASVEAKATCFSSSPVDLWPSRAPELRRGAVRRVFR